MDAAKDPTMHSTGRYEQLNRPQISTVLRLRNLALEDTDATDIVNTAIGDTDNSVNVDIHRHGFRHS